MKGPYLRNPGSSTPSCVVVSLDVRPENAPVDPIARGCQALEGGLLGSKARANTRPAAK